MELRSKYIRSAKYSINHIKDFTFFGAKKEIQQFRTQVPYTDFIAKCAPGVFNLHS